MGKVQQKINKRLKASTLVELLLTMIISGIIFLLVFDGVDIIKRFSNIMSRRIYANQTLLFSHQFMEHLMEHSDSVIARNNTLLFYKGGIAPDSVTIGESSFILKTWGATDTLFTGYIAYRVSTSVKDTSHIDSLFINCVVNVGDFIWLKYGVSSNCYMHVNSAEDHENFK